MSQFIRYKGPGNEIVYDLHWQPKPGEIRAFDDDDTRFENIADSPSFEVATEAEFKAQEATEEEKGGDGDEQDLDA